MKLEIPEQPGVCRWCGCTETTPCEHGCAWANRQQTLCTACTGLDKQVRSKRGRREVAILVQESEGVAP
jgi:hypothetical protein